MLSLQILHKPPGCCYSVPNDQCGYRRQKKTMYELQSCTCMDTCNGQLQCVFRGIFLKGQRRKVKFLQRGATTSTVHRHKPQKPAWFTRKEVSVNRGKPQVISHLTCDAVSTSRVLSLVLLLCSKACFGAIRTTKYQ